jgi:protein-L-isoaspartate(D-aspartate) O-methyltransferase
MSTRLSGIGMTSARTRERLVVRLRESGIRSAAVLEAMRRVPRHLFIDEALAHRAYEDTALPIGHSQTISQPYTVARMTELLFAEETPEQAGATGSGVRRVLEIGTGSGYQTAILCALATEVYSVERIEPLLKSARRCLQELNFRNFRLLHGDGSQGWPEYAPYDAIVVTAAAAQVPAALLDQLTAGGRLVIPVGEANRQELRVLWRTSDGVVSERIEAANFVPLIPSATDRERHGTGK